MKIINIIIKLLLMLRQEIATAEGKKAALEMSARAVREEHADLQKELETVQLSVEAAKADVATAQRELRTLRDKVGLLLHATHQPLVPMQKYPHSQQGIGSACKP